MPVFTLDGIGEIEIKKSARAKKMILAIRPNNCPKLTTPSYVPYIAAKRYALLHKDWLAKHAQPKAVITDGLLIGKSHILNFKHGAKLTSRVGSERIYVSFPESMSYSDEKVQKEALKAITRSMRRQAEAELPTLLYNLAKQHGYSFSEVRCKSLKTRWGSCSSNQIINLNIWLMQLPEDLIEYVLSHELTHLNHPHHQQAFWDELSKMIPDYKTRRARLKQHQPTFSA